MAAPPPGHQAQTAGKQPAIKNQGVYKALVKKGASKVHAQQISNSLVSGGMSEKKSKAVTGPLMAMDSGKNDDAHNGQPVATAVDQGGLDRSSIPRHPAESFPGISAEKARVEALEAEQLRASCAGYDNRRTHG